MDGTSILVHEKVTLKRFECDNTLIHSQVGWVKEHYIKSVPSIKNIKIHFQSLYKAISVIKQVLEDKLTSGEHTIKKHNNFYVYREKYVYIIFPKRGYINCTKLSSYQDIKPAIDHFYTKFNIEKYDYFFKIDNIQASGQMIWKTIDLNKFKLYVNQKTNAKAVYNPSHFPGLNIRVPNKGTIILFSSGKYTIVGSKEENDISIVFRGGFLLIWLYTYQIPSYQIWTKECEIIHNVFKELREIFF